MRELTLEDVEMVAGGQPGDDGPSGELPTCPSRPSRGESCMLESGIPWHQNPHASPNEPASIDWIGVGVDLALIGAFSAGGAGGAALRPAVATALGRGAQTANELREQDS